MEGYSRDLLGGFGAGGDEPGRDEQEKRSDMETEEVELSLGLSLGGRFGLDRKSGGERLARSSSVASILAAEEVALAPPALARTSSLPTMADVEAEKKQGLGDWRGWRGNAVGVESSARAPVPRSAGHGSGVEELPSLTQLAGIMNAGNGLEMDPVAKLRMSGSPSSGSSDGEGKKLEVNTPETLMRTSSLPAFPAGIEDELRKRKESQTLKRLEVKKKRIERRNSSTVSKEAAGQMLEEMNAGAKKVESSDDISMQNKQIGGSGLPPPYQATFISKGNSLSAMPKWQNSSLKGTPNCKNQSLSSAVPPLAEGSNGALPAEGTSSTDIATQSSALAVITAALGPRGEQLLVSGRRSVRAKSMGDVERMMMQEMPCVCTNGLPNGRRVEGFLYKYRKAEEVRIVCLCHGSFLTPVEFVKHAGGGDVANPLRHIIVNPLPPSF